MVVQAMVPTFCTDLTPYLAEATSDGGAALSFAFPLGGMAIISEKLDSVTNLNTRARGQVLGEAVWWEEEKERSWIDDALDEYSWRLEEKQVVI